MKRNLISISIGIACLMLFSCTQQGTAINSEQFGDKWPFTVSEGVLNCQNSAITFTSGNKTYAVNGIASSKGYVVIDEIWKENPKIPGTKLSLGPIIEVGQQLCD